MIFKSEKGFTHVLILVFVALVITMVVLLMMRSSKFNPGDPFDFANNLSLSQTALDDDVKQLSNSDVSDEDFSSLDQDIQSL